MRKKVTMYFLMGPEAVEQRLLELEQKLTRSKEWLEKVMIWRVRCVATGTGGLVKRGASFIAHILIKTIREVQKEQRRLEGLMGSNFRAWEVKKNDPAPSI